jgi:hypothetical protein
LMGFLLAATPTAMLTMGWRGAGGNGGAILWEQPQRLKLKTNSNIFCR